MREFYFLLLVAIFGGQAHARVFTLDASTVTPYATPFFQTAGPQPGSGNLVPPVALSNWIARHDGKSIELRWTTHEEEDHAYFVVEHSADGASFEPLIVITEPQTSYEGLLREYFYVHQYPAVGTNYYRLAQYDVDGTLTHYDIRSVQVAKPDAALVHPNPVKPGQTLGLVSPEGVHEATLYNLEGTVVANYRDDMDSISELTLPANIASGTYVLKAGNQSHRVVVQ
ncbi:T9SS type A sorting domain-containing protein [Neolewinella xylanilytica]|uniref:T9SS type A sorting domain-containing protein n=1 Tax=Neolewinella xylanilytica TaxID=1514080 RepID=UPI000CEAAAB5|nr:T9SS type A sorting domain-containing protein [Neolewinella xylanilytica]